MRLSRLFGKTLRQAPTEAETENYRLLLRAGLVQQLVAGVYSYLPLGWRVMRRIEAIVRDEMDRAGGQELHLPALQPAELWEESGRLESYSGLYTLLDRREAPHGARPHARGGDHGPRAAQRPELSRPAPAALPDSDQVS